MAVSPGYGAAGLIPGVAFLPQSDAGWGAVPKMALINENYSHNFVEYGRFTPSDEMAIGAGTNFPGRHFGSRHVCPGAVRQADPGAVGNDSITVRTVVRRFENPAKGLVGSDYWVVVLGARQVSGP